MSALDDAIAKARDTPPTPFAETPAGRREIAAQAFAAFCAELLVKLPALGLPARQVWYVDHDSYGNPPPQYLGQGWPLVAFGLMVDGKAITYSDAGPSGGSTDDPGVRTLEWSGYQDVDGRHLFYDEGSASLSYRTPEDGDIGWLRPMRGELFDQRFPKGQRHALEDVVAFAVVDLMRRQDEV